MAIRDDGAQVEIESMATKSAATKTVAVKPKVVRPGMATPQKDSEAPEKDAAETPDAPLPVLDLSDAAVKKMIKQAKKRGYVTYEQLNAVMPSEEVTSEKIEDVLAMMNEMGINVVETEETDNEEEEEADEEESEGGDLVEVAPKTPAKSETREPAERTDDPVRMYLREMGSVELLSREGEIAIAKRIEAGREAMIAGLCESPLTFQAIIIWRDELNEGKVFLRDIIDLEARSSPRPRPATARRAAKKDRFRNPISTKTIWKTPCRSPRSRPSSSRKCWKPSTRSPTSSSGCAACKSRTSITSCTRPARSRRARSANTRSSRKRSSSRSNRCGLIRRASMRWSNSFTTSISGW